MKVNLDNLYTFLYIMVQDFSTLKIFSLLTITIEVKIESLLIPVKAPLKILFLNI